MAQSRGRRRKVGKVMREYKRGGLKSGRSGRKVKSRRQAIAIAMSESGQSRNRRAKRKSSAAKTGRHKAASQANRSRTTRSTRRKSGSGARTTRRQGSRAR